VLGYQCCHCFYEEMFKLIHLVDLDFVRGVRGHLYVLEISMLHLFLRGDIFLLIHLVESKHLLVETEATLISLTHICDL
jgi:hypothetical protein